MVLAAFAIVLGGIGPQGGALLKAAAASETPMASSDCARMMEMKGSHEDMDCPPADHDGQENPMTCPADNCTLRCGTFSAPPVASFVHCILPTGLAALLPDFSAFVSATGRPPLPPPRSSILA